MCRRELFVVCCCCLLWGDVPTAQQTCCQWFWGRSRARLSQFAKSHNTYMCIINNCQFELPLSFEFQELPVTYPAEVRTELGSLSRLGRFCVRQFYQFLRLFCGLCVS